MINSFKDSSKELFYVISSTHWDREWYRTFNDFRIRLCDLMDQLFLILETDPGFTCYTLDGQTVILEDYLEIFPEREEQIRKYIKEGRISIGPWYVIPDEFIPSGEATIRNLLIGDEISSRFGDKLLCGYLPDNFGHTSQLPQILKNFKIDNILFFRGLDKTRSKKAEFFWEAPDGTQIMGICLVAGYWNLKSWGHLGMDAATHFQKMWDQLKAYSTTGCYLLINGSDHLYPQPDMSANINKVRMAFPEIEVTNGSLDNYVNSLKSRLDPASMTVIRGELRDGREAALLPGVGSTRYYVKQFNQRCEAELEKYAEPLNLFNFLTGGNYPGNLLRKAWRELVKNHPHDSITGCSADAVMEDVMSRFKHSYEISGRLSELALIDLIAKVNTDSLADGERLLMVYNPLTWSRSDIVEVSISFPAGSGVNDIRIFTFDGREVTYELVEYTTTTELKEFKYQSKEKHQVIIFTVKFIAQEVPGLGYCCYKVAPLALKNKQAYQQYQMTAGIEPWIENEFYRISVECEGTVTVYDKKNNLTYRRLNLFEDRGDCGDEYQFAAPFTDEIFYPVLKGVSVLHHTPLFATLKIELELNIPESLDERYFKRASARVNCPISSYVTLYKGINRIDFKTVIDNKATDHLLCVKFPTAINADFDNAHCAFDVVRRTVAIERFRDGDNEISTPFKLAQLFCNIYDGASALTIAKKGSYEYQVNRSGDGLTAALTLIRSVRWMFREVLPSSRDGQPCTTPVVYTPDAGCRGAGVFEYSLIFHQQDVVTDRAFRAAYDFNYPLRAISGGKRQGGSLPLEISRIHLSDDRIILSAFKKGERDDSLILRMYNIAEYPLDFIIEINFPAQEVYRSNMLEEKLEPVEIDMGQLRLCARPKEIITLKLFGCFLQKFTNNL